MTNERLNWLMWFCIALNVGVGIVALSRPMRCDAMLFVGLGIEVVGFVGWVAVMVRDLLGR